MHQQSFGGVLNEFQYWVLIEIITDSVDPVSDSSKYNHFTPNIFLILEVFKVIIVSQ